MRKFQITWWSASQYGVVVEADSEEQAWEIYHEQVFTNQIDNPINVLYVSDEPYDEEVEEVG